MTIHFGHVYDATTGERLRMATQSDLAASMRAERQDPGGAYQDPRTGRESFVRGESASAVHLVEIEID